ncbi:unnamed protein product [Closterium sp. NIES-64]|nr:unnamed protein product [Closterium sp. NIES-64]
MVDAPLPPLLPPFPIPILAAQPMATEFSAHGGKEPRGHLGKSNSFPHPPSPFPLSPILSPLPNPLPPSQSSPPNPWQQSFLLMAERSHADIKGKATLFPTPLPFPPLPHSLPFPHGIRVFCSWKKKDTRNIGGRANALIAAIRDVPDSKEDVYRALDAWAAFQLDFPLLAVKRALRIMQQEGQWKRILQVCKWMLARGQGRTFGTYDLMMEAMAATGRHAELDGTWERIMGRHLDTVPRATFARVMSLYTQQGRPLKVLEVYGSMIELGVNLDEGMVMQVHRALINIGAEQRAEALLQEHQSVLSPPVGKAVRAEKASSSARTL